MQRTKRYLLAALITAVLTGLGMPGAWAEEKPAQTGTDPRDFAPKFMPYIRHTELENGLEQNETVLFGLFAFSPKFAMTYEIPLAKDVDISDTALRNPTTGVCGPAGFLPGGGVTIPSGLTGFEGDCEETGVGDMNLRFLYRTDWKALGGDWLVGAQFDFPTASEDVLGSESFLAAPMFAYIRDLPQWPGPGAFIAAMNFYFFDLSKDSDRADTSMYFGRWFAMLPLSKKHKIYALPEFQPVYDFENDHASYWIGPEFGKMFAPGRIGYIKPGWGIDPDDTEGDREFTFEIGFRYFFD